MPKKFDYQKVVWGQVPTSCGSFFTPGVLRLKRCLRVLEGVEGRVLDVGCGAGEFTKAIKRNRPDLEMIGVDIGEEALRVANQDPQGVQFQFASATRLPFADSSFEVVLLFEVLEHLEDPQGAVLEAGRVLKKGGIFHFTVPLEASLFTIHGWIKKLFGINLMEKHAGHIQQFNFSDVKNLLLKGGFRIVDFRYSDHFTRQLASVFYVPYLTLTRQELFAVTRARDRSKGPKRIFLSAFLSAATFIMNLESAVLVKFPGLNVQITARKDG